MVHSDTKTQDDKNLTSMSGLPGVKKSSLRWKRKPQTIIDTKAFKVSERK